MLSFIHRENQGTSTRETGAPLALNGALDLKRVTREGTNRLHEQLESLIKQNIDAMLLAIRHAERRLVNRVNGLDDGLVNLNEKIDGFSE